MIAWVRESVNLGLILSGISIFLFQGGPLNAVELPAPTWSWQSEKGMFMEKKGGVSVPELRSLYDPTKDFSLEVRLKPNAVQERLGGILSDYKGSQEGGWYFAMNSGSPALLPGVVVIDGNGSYKSARAVKPLKADQWQTVLLIKEEKELKIWLDGFPILEMPLEANIGKPTSSTFMIGKRVKDVFQGEIESVRLWNFAIPKPKLTEMPNPNLFTNGSFEQGEKLEDALIWHRMAGTEATVNPGWEIDNGEAWHGKRSLRTTTGAPLILTAEVWEDQKDSWVFSVWMKADKEGVECKLGVGAYWRLQERETSKNIKLTKEWKQYEVKVSKLPGESHMRGQGAINFKIFPKESATVWVDAVQWQRGQATALWSDVETDKAVAGKPVYPDARAIRRPEGGESSWTGSIPLRVFGSREHAGKVMPIALGVPFKQKLWDGRGELVLTDAEGKVIPVQSEVLARQTAMGAVRILGLQFVDTVHAGKQEYQLQIKKQSKPESPQSEFQWRIAPASKPGRLWDQLLDSEGNVIAEAASIRAIGLDGQGYDSEWDSEAEWKIEDNGPLYKSFRSAGRLVNPKGEALAGYVARIHLWRDIPGVKVEVSVINTRSTGSVPVRTLYWQTKSGQKGSIEMDGGKGDFAQGRFEKRVIYRPGRNLWEAVTAVDGKETPSQNPKEAQWIGAKSKEAHILLQTPEAWKYNPSAIAWDQGSWQGYLWPDNGVRSLFLPHGLALTREFWLRAAATGNAEAWESLPVGMASAEWWQANEVLLPFAAANPQEHPFMDEVISPENLLQIVSEEKAAEQRAWGIFDYGDFHGDGGWGNMESFRDWATFVTALRTENLPAMLAALRSSRHYRDIDIDQNDGVCYVHNAIHMGGSKDTSHAWPGGVALNYLLTGSKRSKEVILLHGESILATDEEFMATRGLRSLGRWLLNLGDVYLVSGDERYKEKYFSQIERSRVELKKDSENPDRSIFSYIGHWDTRRLVPFHAWYGIAALQIMEDLTGDKRLSKFITEEINATLNRELYYKDIEQLWPGLELEEGMPLMLADFARGRGSFAYPVLIRESEKPGREFLKNFALEALYCWAIEGRMVKYIEATLTSTPVREVHGNEGEWIKKAQDLMWKGAAPEILNGDFTLAKDSWKYWRPFPGKSISYHTNWERRRKEMVAIDETVARAGKPSLRYNLTPASFRSRISVETTRFRLPVGTVRISGWVRHDEGATLPDVGIQIRDLEGGYSGKLGIVLTGSTKNYKDAVEVIQGEISPPDKQGWRYVEATLDVKKRAVASLIISTGLVPGKKEGHAWLNSFHSEPSHRKK